jgi:hypothetical protein
MAANRVKPAVEVRLLIGGVVLAYEVPAGVTRVRTVVRPSDGTASQWSFGDWLPVPRR